MSYQIPLSWQSSGTTLASFTTVIGTIPSPKVIYMVEQAGDISNRNARLSNNANSAATLCFYTNEETLTNPTLNYIFTKSILGGFNSGDSKKHKPMKHPHFTGMYAKDIIEFRSCALESSLPEAPYSSYNVASVIVSFESLPYSVDLHSGSDGYDYQWIEKRAKPANARSSLGLGGLTFTSGPWTGKLALGGLWYSQPQNYIELIIHQVESSLIWGNDSTGLLFTFSDSLGCVNSATFGGCPAGTLLFDSCDILPYKDWFNQELNDVKMNLIYNGWGWNKQKDYSFNLNDVAFGGVPPFLPTSFSTLINSLNKVA